VADNNSSHVELPAASNLDKFFFVCPLSAISIIWYQLKSGWVGYCESGGNCWVCGFCHLGADYLEPESDNDLCFNGHLQHGPRLAGTRISPFYWVMEVMVTTGAVRRAKL